MAQFYKTAFFCLLLCLVVFGTAQSKPQEAALTPDEIFTRVDRHFDAVQTMSFKVERLMERGLQNQTEKWGVDMEQPNSFRVDVEGPPRRILLNKGEFYSEYIPEAKKALELDISKLSPERQKEFFSMVTPRVAIPGLRLAISEDLKKSLEFRVVGREELNGRPCFYIEGRENSKNIGNVKDAKNSSGRMRIWIDQERFTFLKMEIYQGEKFLNSIENKSFVEFKSGYWFPEHVQLKRSTPEALEKVTYRFSRITINRPFAEKYFEPRYEAGVKVVQENPA